MKLHAFVDQLFTKKSDANILLIDLHAVYDLLIKPKTDVTLVNTDQVCNALSPPRSLNLPGLKPTAYRQKSKRLFCFAADEQSIG